MTHQTGQAGPLSLSTPVVFMVMPVATVIGRMGKIYYTMVMHMTGCMVDMQKGVQAGMNARNGRNNPANHRYSDENTCCGGHQWIELMLP